MCLWVRTAYHPDYQPLVAEEDLYVAKGIVVCKPDNTLYPTFLQDGPYMFFLKETYYTPFTQTPVDFDDEGKCVMKMKNIGWDLRKDVFGASIAEGIHSLSYMGVWDGYARLDLHTSGGDELMYFDAIIPKGTKYYAGQDFDYASEELIIYKYGGGERVKNAKKT